MVFFLLKVGRRLPSQSWLAASLRFLNHQPSDLPAFPLHTQGLNNQSPTPFRAPQVLDLGVIRSHKSQRVSAPKEGAAKQECSQLLRALEL